MKTTTTNNTTTRTIENVQDFEMMFEMLRKDYIRLEEEWQKKPKKTESNVFDVIEDLDKKVEAGELDLKEAKKILNSNTKYARFKTDEEKIKFLMSDRRGKGNCKKIVCEGMTFNSVIEAASHFKVNRLTITRWLKTGKAHTV